MWSTILLNATLSVIIILIAHHIWEYCKQNYTTQKTKNLVEIQASKYKQIAEDIERNSNALISVPNPSQEQEQTSPNHLPHPHVSVKLQSSDFLSIVEKEWVQKELTTFIDTL
jgi:hypothetical protein